MKKEKRRFTDALYFNILVEYYWLCVGDIYAPREIEIRKLDDELRLRDVDLFLSFCFYMQLLFDVLLYEYAGMLNRG